jgi:hypothetical protein
MIELSRTASAGYECGKQSIDGIFADGVFLGQCFDAKFSRPCELDHSYFLFYRYDQPGTAAFRAPSRYLSLGPVSGHGIR